ncbi:RNA 2'-phosphotransferase [Agromyces sp. C10]|uniref:RNA 2'-phosphotransferase n=1 Tax=Agromyces sp. C10 TaxID=2935077 RepID=UPI00200A2B31|nr:RNA 2'-phosphotransferase [Agromyces sp. C10]MCK8607908.1 RNA 2'-phosphotransferase [Agromyces sp. C10]
MDPNTSGFQLVRHWAQAREAAGIPLIAALVQEERLSRGAMSLGPYFRSHGLSLSGALLRAREQVAWAALDAAFAASWRKRMVFSQALGLARTYLTFLIEAAKLSEEVPDRSLRVRFGISTVLAARFGLVELSQLESACEALLDAHQDGADNALTYFLEGCLWRYDLFGEKGALESAARTIGGSAGGTNLNATWYLNCGELWTKLAGEASTVSGRKKFLERALHATEGARLCNPAEAETVLRIVMLQALLDELGKRGVSREIDISTRGIRLPFCMRTSHAVLSPTLEWIAPALVAAISRDRRAGEFVFRDVLSELHSYLAKVDRSNAREHLRNAIRTRSGAPKGRPLRGHRSRLADAEDKLNLARLSSNVTLRREALTFLGTPSGSQSDDATKLIVMAQDIESNGPVPGSLLRLPEEIAFAVRSGDAATLFGGAASLAIRSHELQRRRLGGRGGVIVLQDAENSIGQTFVFKALSSSAYQHDLRQTQLLSKRIRATGQTNQFGVIDHLATVGSGVPGMELGDDALFSVRRYNSGKTLDEVIRLAPSNAEPVVHRTARFLALFHARANASSDGLRRCLWEREFGRWLKAICDDEERAAVFASWWNIMCAAPPLQRRDSHALNWLVEPSGRVLAVDLDARGTRPFGYELAQLLEDVPLYDAADWVSRSRVLRFYLQALLDFGATDAPAHDEAMQYLAGGVIARAAWMFSAPGATSHHRVRAGQLLIGVEREFQDFPIGEVARTLHNRWTEIAGVASEDGDTVLDLPDRRRISRAMAYHLRHNPYAPATKDGWVHVEELTELLNASGYDVTPGVLMLIAGAAGEPRFQRDGQEIRAVYGHSVKRDIKYDVRTPPASLYHATPLENLASIFEARSGLLKGSRQWVHLSDRPAMAMNASRRQGKPVALLRVDAARTESLVHAAASTWLAPRVGPEMLEIVPAREVASLLVESSDA